jgi:homogentisate 1,2-dioxygenase
MRSWIHFTRGRFVRQARVGLGELREEHLSRHGFQGPVAMIYRTAGPNEIVRVEGDYRRREIDSADVVASDATDPRGSWQVLLSNDDVAVGSAGGARRCRIASATSTATPCISCIAAPEPSPPNSVRSAEPGDYVMLPKSTTYRHMPDPGDSLLLVVESPAPIRLTEHEQVGRHTPIDPTMLDVPDIVDYGWPEEREYEVRIKAGGGHTSIFYKNDPLKVVGWKGDLFPYKFNVKSILPIMSNRIHLAPSSWATFEATGFVVVSFVPQIAVADLDAEELPSYHRNIDMDEVILSHANDDPGGRRPGGFSFTPQGILHGATEEARAAFNARRKPGDMRRWTGIGVDTYRPLKVSDAFARMTG